MSTCKGTCLICYNDCEIWQCKECLCTSCKECSQLHTENCKLLKEENFHICKVHNELVKQYCCQCQQLTCKECAVDTHPYHSIVSLLGAKENILNGMSEIIADVNNKWKHEISTKNSLSNMREEFVIFQKSVEEEEKRLQKLLLNVKTSLLQPVTDICKEIAITEDNIAMLSTLKNDLDHERQKQKLPIILLLKLSNAMSVIEQYDKQKVQLNIEASIMGLKSDSDVSSIFRNALINESNYVCQSNNDEEDMEVSSPSVPQDDINVTPSAIGNNSTTVNDSQTRNEKRLAKQLDEMPTAIANKEDEVRLMMELSQNFPKSIEEIDRLEIPSGSVNLRRHNIEVVDTFAERCEALLNISIRLKNELIKATEDMKDKCNSIAEWTTSETAERERERQLHFGQIEEYENKIKSLELKNGEMKQQSFKLQQQNFELQKQLQQRESNPSSILLKERDALVAKVQSTNDLLNRREAEIEYLSDCMAKQKKSIEEKDGKLFTLKKEKDDLQSRLSSIAGEKLTRGNPEITDLGDPNRPMKIGDKYGELYDNEWTDAMESIDDVQRLYPSVERSTEIEEIIIHHLYRILMYSYHQCIDLAENQLLTTAKTLCPFITDQELKTFPLRKYVLEEQRKNAESFVAYILQEQVPSSDDVIQDWNYVHANKDLISILMQKPFYGKCVYLCWSMAIQDPKMYLKEELKPGSKYDKNTYKEFVTSGDTVRYVVWPALFLYEGGPLLFKGIVQAYKG